MLGSGAAHAETARAAHSHGGMLLHQVDNEADARAALESGADGLSLLPNPPPRGNFALLKLVRKWFRGPLALGGVPFMRGATVVAAQAAGADIVHARITPAEAARHRAAWATPSAGR